MKIVSSLYLTVAAHESVGHGLIATVREGPVAPPIRTLHRRLGVLVPFALSCADADDAMHQLALCLLLLQVVVLGDAVDELADLIGLTGEGGVRCALGQLVNLMKGVELQQFLGNERVNVGAGVTQVIKVQVLPGVQAGVADWPLAVALAGCACCAGNMAWLCRKYGYRLTCNSYILVAEAVAGRQFGGFGRLAGLQWYATGGVGHSHAIGGVGLTACFGGVVCGALVDRQAGLSAAIEAAGQDTAD